MSRLKREIAALNAAERNMAATRPGLAATGLLAGGAELRNLPSGRPTRLYHVGGKFYAWGGGPEVEGPRTPELVTCYSTAGPPAKLWTWIEKGERAWKGGKRPMRKRPQLRWCPWHEKHGEKAICRACGERWCVRCRDSVTCPKCHELAVTS